jgi:hypothetical protein
MNPIEEPAGISDPDTHLALDLFMACGNALERTYTAVRQSLLRWFPEIDLLSYGRVKNLVATISGVISIVDDMCVNSCHAFMGPFSDLQACHVCSEPRFDPNVLALTGKKVTRKQACTIPLGPQIQVLGHSEDSMTAMCYWDNKTRKILGTLPKNLVYDNIFAGSTFLDLHHCLNLSCDDTTVIFLDGAQLYQNKKLDTWIVIWIITDYNPKTHYKKKHILPVLIIPGPLKPKILDSYLFQTFHHFSAIQHIDNGSGLHIWDHLK